MAPTSPDPLRPLLTAIAQREALARVGGWSLRGVLAGAALALVLLLLARLVGVRGGLPFADDVWLLGLPVVGGLVAAIAAWRPVPTAWAARRLDTALAKPDLFTTAHDVARDPVQVPGAYQRVVLAQALSASAGVAPATIRPLAPVRPMLVGGGALLVLTALLLALPQLDPFGTVERSRKQAERQAELTRQVQVTKQRLAQLAQAKADQPLSPEAQAELAKLVETFAKLQPAPPKGNAPVLAKAQSDLGKALAANPMATPDPAAQNQRLGGDQRLTQAMREALAKGDGDRLGKEMDQLKQLAKEAAAAKDPVVAQQKREELRRRLESVAQSLGQKGAGAKAAVQQAMDQLAQTSSGGDQQAMDALQDSLELAQAELQGMAQGTRDAEALKDALKTLRMARQLDAQGRMGECKNGSCKSLAEYTAMYATLCNGQGKPGAGKGMGKNPGQGQGGQAKENDLAATDFRDEKSPSQMTAGETILSWKTKGPSETGVAREDYRSALAQARQEAGEALEREQLPADQRAAVQRYFADVSAEAGSTEAVPEAPAKPATADLP